MARINFIPNDPLAANAPPQRRIRPPKYPRGKAARFRVQPSAPAGLYAPHTPEFDFWQTQTALIFGLRRWRESDGSYLPRWFGNQAVLRVLTNAGDDLNAFYDRDTAERAVSAADRIRSAVTDHYRAAGDTAILTDPDA